MSAQETTDNFWQVWNSFKWPDPKPVSYRLYYKSDGSADVYTMEDLPGDFVEVTKEIYLAAPHNAKVEDGILKIIPVSRKVSSLVCNQPSGTRCHLQDVCIVVTGDQPGTNWDSKEHEID